MNKKGQEELILFGIVGIVVLFSFWLIYNGFTTGNSDRLFIGMIGIGLSVALGKAFSG